MVFSNLTARDRVSVGEINNLPSCTIPGQVVPLRDLIRKYANGIPLVGNSSEPMYYGDEIPDPKSMDLSQLQEYREYLQQLEFDFKRQEFERANNPKPMADSGSASSSSLA